VSLSQMVTALAEAIEHPPDGVRMLTVPEIRRAGRVIQQDEG